VAPLPTILALRDAWVHVCSMNGHDVPTNIEAPVDKHFGIAATLYVPYIYPDNSHARFRRYLNYSWP